MWMEYAIIGLIFLGLFLLLLLLLSKIRLRKLKKNYDEEKDLSKKGEQRRFVGGGTGVGESEIGDKTFKHGRSSLSNPVETNRDERTEKKRDRVVRKKKPISRRLY